MTAQTFVDPFEAAEEADRFLAEKRTEAWMTEQEDAERYAALHGKPLSVMFREAQERAAAEGRAPFRDERAYIAAAAREARTLDDVARAKEVQRQRAARDARRLLAAQERASVPMPELLTLEQLLARPRTGTVPRIDGLQAVGQRSLLAAAYKAGKSTMVGNLARCLADGGQFLGAFEVRAVTGTVCILDFEMSPHQAEDWLAAQGIKNRDRVVLMSLRGAGAAFDILDKQVRAELAARLRAARVEYLILDCLRPIMDALGLDENHDAGRLLVAFDAFMAEVGATDACVVHHMGHAGERARGDSRLRDWPDVEWRLVRKSDDPNSDRYFTAYGRDVEVPESRLAFDEATRHLSIVGGSRRSADTEAALDAIVGLLAGAPEPMSGNAIEQALAGSGHTQKAIRDARALGVQRGHELGSNKHGSLHVTNGARGAKLYSLPTSSLAR